MCYTKGEFSIKSNEIGLKDAFTDEVKVIWIIPKAVFDEITKPKKEYGLELHGWSKDRVVEVKNNIIIERILRSDTTKLK